MHEYTDINEEIFRFTDYRRFLKHFYEQKKKGRGRFSYRSFAEKAGFSSPSFIRQVIRNEKNLTKESVIRLCRAMGLNQQASDYFENLVFFSQAKTFDDKKFFLDKIDLFHKKNTPDSITEKEFEYLSEWYHPVIRELAENMTVNGSESMISQKLLFPLPPAKIRSSLNFLIENGFLEQMADGRLRKKEKTLSTGSMAQNELLAVTARAFHKLMATKSMESISLLAGDQRKTTDSTLSLSEKSFKAAQERINALRYELLELAAADETADRVFQLHLNLFPLTDYLNDKTE